MSSIFATPSRDSNAVTEVTYGPDRGHLDTSTWASLIAAFFREPLLSRTGVAWRAVLLLAFLAGLTALLIVGLT